MDKKKITTNTLFLYLRMCIMLIISLVASRILLKNLGVIDYGVYNVVYGLVLFFSFMKGTLTNGTQRFLNYSMGKGIKESLNLTFRAAFSNHLIIAILILALVIIIGNPIISFILKIPEDRIIQSYILFNTAAISLFFSILTVPFEAAIIAHEEMNAFALFSIIDSSLKLLAAYLLILIPFEYRISIYGILLLIISLIIFTFYIKCATYKYEEVKCKFYWNNKINLEMLYFSGWDTLGWGASACAGQGFNVLLNIYGGPLLNAARGISVQVYSLINQLINSFQNAINPQMVKTYAKGEYTETNALISSSSKYSIILASFIATPLIIDMGIVLRFWLGEIPEFSIIFSRIMIIQSLIVGFTRPIVNGVHASGKIKKPCIYSSAVLFLIVPTSWFLLKLGISPSSVLLINIIPWILEGCINFSFLHRLTRISGIYFTKNIIIKPLIVIISSFLITHYLSIFGEGLIKVAITTIINMMCLSTLTFLIVLQSSEKKKITSLIIRTIKK